jgi:hypothetical protein
MTPIAAPDSRVSTTPRRSGSSITSAPASTRYCQGWLSSRVSVIAEPRMAPMAAGPAPSREARDPLALFRRRDAVGGGALQDQAVPRMLDVAEASVSTHSFGFMVLDFLG